LNILNGVKILIEKNINTAYIALGSNKGDKLGFLKYAVEKINEDDKCQVELSSSVFETKPYKNFNKENFLNAVIKISTDYNLKELFYFLKETERNLGRKTTEKWGDREIDLDILFFNDIIYKDDIITVPHKELHKRDFVMIPLCEIEPGLIHSELKQKICDITVEDSEKCVIRKLSDKIIIE
jgi:2-amino-4-hydroxy-6-hydroxymethyldihydropteridine diphosphokinase